MCNQYTTGFTFGQSGCGYNTYGYNTCGYNTYGNGNGTWGGQTICRDCCGNILVNQRRRNCCGCCNPCCCNGNVTTQNGGATQNGNGQTGRFTCITVCGVNNTTATTCGVNNAMSAGDLYYARQYGLYPFGYNRGCGCTLDAVHQT